MKKSLIQQQFGRQAFGADPAGYHSARPDYPDWVFEMIRDRCGARQDTATFEIGAGTGKATRKLLDLGANPLIAVEPDPRLASFLRSTITDEALNVNVSSFEQVLLTEDGFDLGVCATAFHWLDENSALTKIASLLKPGGWWAMIYNVFGDPDRDDPFHEATKTLLDGPASPSEGNGDLPFSLDVKSRITAIQRCGAFHNIEHRAEPWSLILDPAQTVALYATYSNINIRPDSKSVLADLKQIARVAFNGRVTRNMITTVYLAQRI